MKKSEVNSMKELPKEELKKIEAAGAAEDIIAAHKAQFKVMGVTITDKEAIESLAIFNPDMASALQKDNACTTGTSEPTKTIQATEPAADRTDVNAKAKNPDHVPWGTGKRVDPSTEPRAVVKARDVKPGCKKRFEEPRSSGIKQREARSPRRLDRRHRLRGEPGRLAPPSKAKHDKHRQGPRMDKVEKEAPSHKPPKAARDPGAEEKQVKTEKKGKEPQPGSSGEPGRPAPPSKVKHDKHCKDPRMDKVGKEETSHKPPKATRDPGAEEKQVKTEKNRKEPQPVKNDSPKTQPGKDREDKESLKKKVDLGVMTDDKRPEPVVKKQREPNHGERVPNAKRMHKGCGDEVPTAPLPVQTHMRESRGRGGTVLKDPTRKQQPRDRAARNPTSQVNGTYKKEPGCKRRNPRPRNLTRLERKQSLKNTLKARKLSKNGYPRRWARRKVSLGSEAGQEGTQCVRKEPGIRKQPGTTIDQQMGDGKKAPGLNSIENEHLATKDAKEGTTRIRQEPRPDHVMAEPGNKTDPAIANPLHAPLEPRKEIHKGTIEMVPAPEAAIAEQASAFCKKVEEQLKFKAFIKMDALRRMEVALNQHLQHLQDASSAAGKDIGDSKHALGLLHEVKEAIGKKEKDEGKNPIRREFKQDGRTGVASHA
jgi:hypothetical protein